MLLFLPKGKRVPVELLIIFRQASQLRVTRLWSLPRPLVLILLAFANRMEALPYEGCTFASVSGVVSGSNDSTETSHEKSRQAFKSEMKRG